MKETTDQSKINKFSLTRYRKSILTIDCISGAVITAIGFSIFFLFGLGNTLLTVSIVGYLILSCILFFYIKKEKYILATYFNLIGSILLIVIPTLIYGNNLYIQFFLLSLSLSAFIYTSNEKFNQIFFIIHLVIFAAISLITIDPIYHLTPELQKTTKSTALVLFTISFSYKMLFVFSIYIRNYESADKKHLIYQTLFDNSYDGIITTTYNKLTKQITENKNEKVLSFFDALEDELSIEKLVNFFPQKQPNGEFSTDYFDNIDQVLKEGNTRSFKFTFKKKNGKLFNALITAITIQEVFEDITVYLFKDITQEITDKRTIQHQIEELNEKNNRLQKYIDSQLQFENFAHLAAHDLKTPIRTLVSFSEILEESIADKISEEEKNYIEFIKNAASKISWLITDLSSFAELNTASFKFNMVDSVLLENNIYSQIENKFINVDYKISSQNLPGKILADWKYIHILFYELVANAIFYRKSGQKCEVKIYCIEKNNFYQFSISDNGIGIKKEDQAGIFTIFKKANNNEMANNSGIGLAICSKIVEMHKGKIWVESQPNKGATFSFTISKTLLA